MKLLKLSKKIFKHRSIFDISVDKQKQIVNRFLDPKDNVERSFFQYVCQKNLDNNIKYLLLNLAALFFLPYFYFKKNDCLYEEDAEAVFLSAGVVRREILPEELTNQYQNVVEMKELSGCLDKEGKNYFFSIAKRYPFSFYFLLKILIKIRIYTFALTNYNPKTIIVCGEYSFTSSVLTEYCNRRGVQHVDVMHGEKLFYIRDGFFYYNSVYVWDEHYIKLFNKLRADAGQFVIALPPSMQKREIIKTEKEVDYTYYLQKETCMELKNIRQSLMKLYKKGKKVAIRPHPIYSDINTISDLFDFCEIERKDAIDIISSISRTRNVISLYSTVLYQAYLNDIQIIIDDISNQERYKRLLECDYMMLNKEHKLLSNEISVVSG